MLWPALRALSSGELSEDQVTWLRETFGLTEGPRTEGPAADISLAHRKLTDSDGVELVLDLSCMNDDAWVFTLFQATADKPSAAFVEQQRVAFRAAMEHVGLHLIQIDPAAKADEVLDVPPDPADAWEDSVGYWFLPDELERVWWHLGLRLDAPREVKEVKLRQLMQTPVWNDAPERVVREAQEFLDGH